MRVRTGYSFRSAVGSIDNVMKRLQEVSMPVAPISDRASTFGYVRWRKAAKEAGLRPVYGVELAVTESLNAKKPAVDFWTFFAYDDLRHVNALVEMATNQFHYQPMLTYDQALKADGVVKIMGHRPLLGLVKPRDDLFLALAPSTSRGLFKMAQEQGFQMIAASDNHYARPEDKALYEVLCGRGASSQTYPQHILSDAEWHAALSFVPEEERLDALRKRNEMLALCQAELRQGVLLHPEKKKTLRQMCLDGAKLLGCDLERPVYAARLEKELGLIAEKDFEDYFFIIADVLQWARSQMICGPARGSSCGSLVCYLLQITTIDPIPYDLIFERFIDTTRSDLPDIDLDFSDTKRHLVFEYMIKKYGQERVARLGTVALYKPRSAISEAGAALDIPRWKTDRILESIVERSSGDSRALQIMEDTFNDTPAGQALIAEFPELKIAEAMEGHPRHSSQHAAGIVLTEEPVINYIAVDSRTGATQCDKKDAEELNLLKIDALGLTQLSVFEDALEMAGLPMHHLESVPLDDQEAFDVINKGQFSGIFQYNGVALQSIANQIKTRHIEDIIITTALARPGPMASGQTNEWVKRKRGDHPVTYPHDAFIPYLKGTSGIICYQETIMQISRELGDLTWADTTALRKAMSKSLGKEYFDQFGDRWKAGAMKKGIPQEALNSVWDNMTSFGAWCLSGDTVLRNPHNNQHSKDEFTLKELYDSGGLAPGKMQAGGRRQKLFMWDGKGLKPSENIQVTFSGRKETFIIVTKSGKTIRATKEHRFLTRGGTYRAVLDLQVGDGVMIIGDRQLTQRKAKTETGSGRHNWRNTEKTGGLFFNGKRGQRSKVLKRDKRCKCGAGVQEVHHKNMNHHDHRMANLIGVCRKCHKAYHAAAGTIPKAYQKGRGIKEDFIISITPYGIEEVYDVSMPAPHYNFLANDFVVHNCFNRSHAVAYGLVSYWCCWLKAHHPFEFAAATLQHETDPAKQIQLLREMDAEGIKYIPVDKDQSTDKWQPAIIEGRRVLLGPVQNVKGIGPKMVSQIVSARARNEPLPSRAMKLLENPKTDIDSLWPVRDAFQRLMPDPTARHIFTKPTRVIDIQTTGQDYEVLAFVVAKQIKPKDENEAVNVAKRGYKLNGPTAALNLHLADDTDTIFCKVGRFDYMRLGKEVAERGKPGKALYAVKGTVPSNFRMIRITQIRYIGDMDEFPDIKATETEDA